MTAKPTRCRGRHAPAAAWQGAAVAGPVAILVGRRAVAGDREAGPLAETPAPERPAVLLEPVPIDALSSRSGAPSLVPEARPASWGDPRLAVCLAVLAALVLCLRWTAGRRTRPLPAEVCQVLGEVPLGGVHVARVVRFGPKTILVGVTGGGCTPLAEIDDAALTDRMVAACRAAETGPAKGIPFLAGVGRGATRVPRATEAVR